MSDSVRFIESVFGRGRLSRNTKNIDVRCPICAPSDKEKKKLSIRTDDHRSHCWTCDWCSHTLAPLLKKHGELSKLAEYRALFFHSNVPVEQETQHVKSVTLPKDFTLLTLAGNDPDAMATRAYVSRRGLTSRDMWRFKMGMSNDFQLKRRVVVPSFDSMGAVNYYVARAIDSYKRPKYSNPDVDKLPIIFNELDIDWTTRLVVCEGVFDMFKCGENVVPLLGSDLNEMSALFNSIIVNSTPVAVALDGDMWSTKTIKAAKKLAEYNVDVVIVDTRSYGDPGSASKQQFADSLADARPFEWVTTFMTKLTSATRTQL